MENPLNVDKLQWNDIIDTFDPSTIRKTLYDYGFNNLFESELNQDWFDMDFKDIKSIFSDVMNKSNAFAQEDTEALGNNKIARFLIGTTLFDTYTQSHNYDGYYYRDRENPGTTYVIFDPSQVKSAIGNIGTYDPNNPDITKQAIFHIKQKPIEGIP